MPSKSSKSLCIKLILNFAMNFLLPPKHGIKQFGCHAPLIMKIFDTTVTAYKCCCGCMNVVTGTKIICGITLFECLMSVVAWVIAGGPFIGGISMAARIVIAAYAAYLPFAGIRQKKPIYFIPYLFYLVTLIICAGFAAFAFSSALKPNESELGYVVREWIKEIFELQPLPPAQIDDIIFAFAFFAFIISLLSTWFFSVIFKCFKYISEINKSGYAKITLPTTSSY